MPFDVWRTPEGAAARLEEELRLLADSFAHPDEGVDNGWIASVVAPLDVATLDAEVFTLLLGTPGVVREAITPGSVEYRLPSEVPPGEDLADLFEVVWTVSLKRVGERRTELTLHYLGTGQSLERGWVQVRRGRFMDLLDTLALLLPRGEAFALARPGQPTAPVRRARGPRGGTLMKAKKVRDLIAQGKSKTAACREVGMDIRDYEAYSYDLELLESNLDGETEQ